MSRPPARSTQRSALSTSPPAGRLTSRRRASTMRMIPQMSLENPHPVALDPPVAQAPPLARPILRDGIPDWDAITFDVFCSRCGYNLRTLTRPLCTECGLEFDWGIVLDRAVDRSLWQTSFLFEHLWLRRPIRSWFKTVWRSFRPRRFWGHVSIHDPIETQPLWFMMVMSIVAFILNGGESFS